MKDTVAIVVTYNRKELLEECIHALLEQTDRNFDICIIDNKSTDGTEQLARDWKAFASYKNTGRNLGGAGGFAFGIRYAAKKGYTYCWLMDDDTVPEKEAFASLMEKTKCLNGEFAFLGSMVYWTDKSPCIMNMTDITKDWYMQEERMRDKLVPVHHCSFVSVLIPISAVKTVGLPIRQFFLYGDDCEYTNRLRKTGEGYMDLDSIVIHKMALNAGTDLAMIPKEKISRCYYDSRNRFYIARQNGARGIISYFYHQARFAVRILKTAPDKKAARLFVLCKGTMLGFFFFPRIEML